VALIYLESPANPTNVLVDVEAVAAARAAAFADQAELPPIAIDNTFLGPLWAKPLNQGADISVYSLTKYVGGHSDLVAGGLVGKRALLDKVRLMRNVMGGICDPNSAWMLLAQPGNARAAHEQGGESAQKNLRISARPSQGSKRSVISDSWKEAPARRTFTSAIAPALARPSRSTSKVASARPSLSSTGSRSPTWRSAWAEPRLSLRPLRR
jgi:hypothetical protein